MNDNNAPEYGQQLDKSRQIWDSVAATFDEQPDHGLLDPVTLRAWTKLLRISLPSTRGTVLDIGCGTGSLSVVLAGLGYEVTGIDLSPEMISLAKVKASAAQHSINFHVMDAAFPQFPAQQFDAIVCRHLLWALPEPGQVLERWVQLLKADGCLLMIEGFWHTGAGLHAQEIMDMLPASLTNSSMRNLSDLSDLWGHKVEDERYAITAHLRS